MNGGQVARTRDPEVHALRRDEFVDVALRLMQTKGWAATSIQDVLAETGASKGAFYHYFSSKSDLLEAVIERIPPPKKWADERIRGLVFDSTFDVAIDARRSPVRGKSTAHIGPQNGLAG